MLTEVTHAAHKQHVKCSKDGGGASATSGTMADAAEMLCGITRQEVDG